MKYKLINEQEHKIWNPFIDSNIIDIIFQHRNVDNITEFVSPMKVHLIDPFLLDNIEDGIELLEHHINNNSEILIIVDSDVDGFTSAAILYNYLHKQYSKINIKWEVHKDRSHGINFDFLQNNPNVKLIICPDSSSNEYDKHAELKKQNIDVLVIDHHDAEKYSENAVVINNKLSDKYKNKWLSGAGVVFKFCQAIDIKKKTNFSIEYIDLAALGIIADMMDVRELENQYIIQRGLKNIQNPFFSTLVRKQAYSLGSQPINAVGIMFYISPLINAVTRVGTLEERQNMFKAFITGEEIVNSCKRGAAENEKETIAEKATREAVNARNRQKRLIEKTKEDIELTLDQNETKDSGLLFIQLDNICNQNLTGLVANQLASKYKKPVLLLIDKGDGIFTGSGRNYGFSEIKELKNYLSETELFDFAEGHQSAFGVQINEENINDFIAEINASLPSQEIVDNVYNVDFIFSGNGFDINIIKDITKLRQLWGKGFDEPLIAIENLTINGNNLQIMGQKSKHIKFTCNDIEYIKFYAEEEEIANFTDKQLIINVVGRCGINIFRDSFNYQVVIQEYEIVKEADEFAF